MAAASRTNQTQRSGAARAADDEDFVAIYDLTAGETITFLVERVPFPVTVESLENFELFRAGEFNGSEQ